jgi:hypothetical protein
MENVMRRFRAEKWVKRPDVVLVSKLVRKKVSAQYVTCSEPMQEKSGVAGWLGPDKPSSGDGGFARTVPYLEGGLDLNFASAVFGFGPSVGATYVKLGNVYSFFGNTCRFTLGSGSVCDNGQERSYIVSVDGEIQDNSIDFKYTIEFFAAKP